MVSSVIISNFIFMDSIQVFQARERKMLQLQVDVSNAKLETAQLRQQSQNVILFVMSGIHNKVGIFQNYIVACEADLRDYIKELKDELISSYEVVDELNAKVGLTFFVLTEYTSKFQLGEVEAEVKKSHESEVQLREKVGLTSFLLHDLRMKYFRIENCKKRLKASNVI